MIGFVQYFKLRRPIFNNLNLILSNIVIVCPQKSLKINLAFFIQIENFEQTAYLFLQKTLFLKTFEKLLHFYL